MPEAIAAMQSKIPETRMPIRTVAKLDFPYVIENISVEAINHDNSRCVDQKQREAEREAKG